MHARRGVRPSLPFSFRLLWARVRNWLAHRRALRIGVRLLLLLVMITMAQSASRQVRLAKAEWGDTIAIAVADEALIFGEQIEADDFDLVVMPAHLAPPDALSQLPVDGFVLRDLKAGDFLTSRDVASEREAVDSDAAGRAVRADELIPAGFRTVGVPQDASTSHLVVGDEVDLVIVHVNLPGSQEHHSTSQLPEPGLIVGHDDEMMMVAVPQTIINDVVAAIAVGQLVAVLR